MTKIDRDLDTLLEEVSDIEPELAESMQKIIDGLEPDGDGFEVTTSTRELPVTGRDRRVFVLAAAFGSALEREYPAPSEYGDE